MLEDLAGSHPGIVGVTALHALALLVSAPGVLWRKKGLKTAGLVVFTAAFLANTAAIVEMWIEGGRPPFKTLFETMIFYPWCVALVTLILVGIHRLHLLVPFAAGVSLAGLIYALARPDVETINLPPALQSAWFVPHVVTYFVSYAGLFASAVLAGAALLAPLRRSDAGTTTEEALATYAHHAAVFGAVTLTLGLVMGAAWGKSAWGDYWSWDPKENWALVTWLAYMAYLHLRLSPGWQGRWAMLLLLISFGAVVFTYLGMNALPTAENSLHVYQ